MRGSEKKNGSKKRAVPTRVLPKVVLGPPPVAVVSSWHYIRARQQMRIFMWETEEKSRSMVVDAQNMAARSKGRPWDFGSGFGEGLPSDHGSKKREDGIATGCRILMQIRDGIQ